MFSYLWWCLSQCLSKGHTPLCICQYVIPDVQPYIIRLSVTAAVLSKHVFVESSIYTHNWKYNTTVHYIHQHWAIPYKASFNQNRKSFQKWFLNTNCGDCWTSTCTWFFIFFHWLKTYASFLYITTIGIFWVVILSKCDC